MFQKAIIGLLAILWLNAEAGSLPAEFKIQEKQEMTFELPMQLLTQKKTFLTFSARMNLDKQETGATPALRIEVNGVVVNGMRLVNKGFFFHFGDWNYPWFSNKYNAFLVPYYAWNYPNPPDGRFVHEYVLDISTFLQSDDNKVTFCNTFDFPWLKNAVIEVKNLRLVKNGDFGVSETIYEKPRSSEVLTLLRIAATGPHTGIRKQLLMEDDFSSAAALPDVIAPRMAFGAPYQLGREAESLTFSTGEITIGLTTVYQVPKDGDLVKIQLPADASVITDAKLKVDRRIIRKDGWVELHDQATNLSSGDLPVIMDYRFQLPLDKLSEFRLAGKRQPLFFANTENMDFRNYAMTPLVFLGFGTNGVGIYIDDKAFRNQHSVIAIDDMLHLTNDMFYLPPQANYTVVIKLYPAQDGDYYSVLNTLRHDYALYQNIPGLFGFVYRHLDKGYFERSRKLETPAEFKAFYEDTGIQIAGVMGMYSEPRNPAKYGAIYGAEPLPAVKKQMESYLPFIRASRDAEANTRFIAYLDTHLVAVDPNGEVLGGSEKFTEFYADSLSYGENDKPVPYSGGRWLYNITPDLNNRAGKMVFNTLDYYLGEAGFDGIFFDEFNHSKVRTDFRRHDGYTVLLDRTGKIKEKVAIVPLYSEQYLLALAKRALAKSTVVFANEFDCTPDLMRLPLIHFAEPHIQEDDYFVRSAQAGRTPLTLSTTWKSYTSLWSDTKYFLRYGVLTCCYGARMTGDHVLKKVYPITPKEIYPGLVIGEDKMVTSRSGNYTFGRNRKLTAWIYSDPDGLLQHSVHSFTGTDGKEYIRLDIDSNLQVAVITEEK
jgi:hypothetical protein